jgi:3-hydroxyisobutyrate dehydrogenase
MTVADPIRSLAVLGAGIMGAPIARNLAKAGFQVSAWNRTPDKAAPLADHGVRVEDSAAAAARDADAVLTMVTDGQAVEEMMAGEALEAMRDDSLWLQASTIGVAACERMLGLASERGVTIVDCPVIGTKQPAEQGKLIVLAAGPGEARERCEPVFDAIGQKTVWFERPCGASRMKVVVNSWLLALTGGLAETIAVARAVDVDPKDFLQILEGAPMGSPYAQLKGKAMIEHSYEPAFPLRLAAKDASLVEEAAKANGLDPEILRAVRALYERAVKEGHGDEDMAAVHESV